MNIRKKVITFLCVAGFFSAFAVIPLFIFGGSETVRFFGGIFGVTELRFGDALPLVTLIGLLGVFGTMMLGCLRLLKNVVEPVRRMAEFIALVGMFLLIREDVDYVIYGGITIFASVGSNLLNLINLRWLVDLKPVGDYNFRRHLRPIFVFFAMSIATTVYTNMDNVMLGFLKGTTENGYYDAAVKIKNILVGVVASLGTVLLPRMSYYVERGEREAFAKVTERALRFVFLISMPLCVYFILFARPSIYLLSGKAFEASILPMQLIMPTLVFIGLTNIMGIQILVPTGREKQVLYSEIVGAGVNIVANSMLIPQMGAAGAAIGTVMAEISVLVVQMAALRGEILPAMGKIPYLKTVVALAGATAAVWWLLGSGLRPLVVLPTSAVLFFSAYGVLLLVMGERMVREVWSLVWEKTVGKVLKK